MPEPSVRKFVRNQIKDFLIDGEITAGSETVGENVFTNRIRAFDETKLPCISVRTLKENATPLSSSHLSYERVLTLAVVCVARADDELDNVLDEMAAQVENIVLGAFANNKFIKDDVEYINRVDLTDTDLTLDLGNSEIGAVVVSFQVEYDTAFDPLDPAIVDLYGTAAVDLDTVAPQIRASDAADLLFDDEIEIPQD